MSKYNLKAIKEDFKNKGIFYTPKELGLYLKQFLPDKIESIYDPTCGSRVIIMITADSNNGDWLSSPLLENKNMDWCAF